MAIKPLMEYAIASASQTETLLTAGDSQETAIVRFKYDGTYYPASPTSPSLILPGSRIHRDGSLGVGEATIVLNNTDGFWNSVYSGATEIGTEGIIEVYVGAETFRRFTGKLADFNFRSNKNRVDVVLTFRDIISDLLDRRIGDGVVPAVFHVETDPADMVWNMLTNTPPTGAGMDTTESSDNTDINYANWVAWKAALADFDYSLIAYMTSQTVREALLRIAILTNSYIFVNWGGKLDFSPPAIEGESYDFSNCESLEFSGNTRYMKNQFKVYYEYDANLDGESATPGVWVGGYVQVNDTSHQIGQDVEEIDGTTITLFDAVADHWEVGDEVVVHDNANPVNVVYTTIDDLPDGLFDNPNNLGVDANCNAVTGTNKYIYKDRGSRSGQNILIISTVTLTTVHPVATHWTDGDAVVVFDNDNPKNIVYTTIDGTPSGNTIVIDDSCAAVTGDYKYIYHSIQPGLGVFNDVDKDHTIWHATAASAGSDAENTYDNYSKGIQNFKIVNSNLSALRDDVAYMIKVSEEVTGVVNRRCQVIDISLDLESLKTTINARYNYNDSG